MEHLVKPFTVNIGDLRCRFTPDPEGGGYTVRALNRRGVFSQGDTFEEAVEMIRDADRLVAECRAELRKNGKTVKTTRFAPVPRHGEIKPPTVRSICRDLGVPPPAEK